MPLVITLIIVVAGVILGRLVPRTVLLALMAFIGTLFLVVVGSHYHVFR